MTNNVPDYATQRVIVAARSVCEWINEADRITAESRTPDAVSSHVLVDRDDLLALQKAVELHRT